MILSGFFRESGFINSRMSSVVHPGKEDNFTLEFLDILWPLRCFRKESPAIITFSSSYLTRSHDHGAERGS